MEIFAKKEQANAFDKPVDKESQPNTSSTNYSSSSSESTYDTSQKKILFIGVGVIVFICFFAFLMWPEKKVEVVGDATSAEKNVITITSSELDKKTEEEMDNIIREIQLGNIPECKDCEPNDQFVKGDFIYSYILDNNRITELKKQSKEGEVAGVKCKHNNEVGKCEQCTKEKKENNLCQHKNDKNSCQDCKKLITKDLCIHKKDKTSCSICNPNTVDKSKGKCVYKLKSGENYSVLEKQFKSQCKTDKDPKIDRWSPYIDGKNNLRVGCTYTCDCPK
jgi:hypothetical protein